MESFFLFLFFLMNDEGIWGYVTRTLPTGGWDGLLPLSHSLISSWNLSYRRNLNDL